MISAFQPLGLSDYIYFIRQNQLRIRTMALIEPTRSSILTTEARVHFFQAQSSIEKP
jgi:hypothetical protein